MFLDRTVPADQPELGAVRFVREMKAQLGAGIQRAIDAGALPGRHRARRGLPHPRRRDPRRGGRCGCATGSRQGEDADALARDTLEAALTGLRTGIHHDISSPMHCA